MSVKWISKPALLHSLTMLKTGGIHERFLIFLAMKLKGVNVATYEEFRSAADNRNGFFRPYLEVGRVTTSQYYKLFQGEVTPGSASEYSHSSQFTPIRALREEYIRQWVEWSDSDFGIQFKSEYLDAISPRFVPNASQKVSIAALAIYCQARAGSLPEVQTIEDLIADWTQRFHLTSPEMARLFDSAPWDGPDPFQTEEFSLTEVVASTLSQASYSEPPPGGPAIKTAASPLTTIDWDEIDEQTEIPLLGLSDVIQQAIAALKSGTQVMLIGPPGTGKTSLAEQLCLIAIEAGMPGYIISTATSEWSTFETIGGYLPNPESPSSLEFHYGIMLECIESNRWLLVDELNRADIDKAFGEFFTVLSGKRVSLPFRDANQARYVILPPGESWDEGEHPIIVSSDWRMIGTMNTFDKASLFQLSYAFMRRFAFIEVPIPDRENFEKILEDETALIFHGDSSHTSGEKYLELIKGIFLPPDGALFKSGLAVGPAIPKDLIKFAFSRFTGRGHIEDVEILSWVLKGLKAYLFPQFEGQDRKHESLVSTISEALSLDSSTSEDTGEFLSVWTGFESSN